MDDRLLTWDGSQCTNPPDGMEISIGTAICCPDQYNYSVDRSREGPQYGHRGVTITAWIAAYSEEEAQAMCEADLVLLGVVPLPDWKGGDPNNHQVQVGPYRATWSPEGWRIFRQETLVAQGPGSFGQVTEILRAIWANALLEEIYGARALSSQASELYR